MFVRCCCCCCCVLVDQNISRRKDVKKKRKRKRIKSPTQLCKWVAVRCAAAKTKGIQVEVESGGDWRDSQTGSAPVCLSHCLFLPERKKEEDGGRWMDGSTGRHFVWECWYCWIVRIPYSTTKGTPETHRHTMWHLFITQIPSLKRGASSWRQLKVTISHWTIKNGKKKKKTLSV